MTDETGVPKKHGFFHDGFERIYNEENAKRKPKPFNEEDLARRIKNLEERRGESIDETLKRIPIQVLDMNNPLVQWMNAADGVTLSTEEHNVGEAIGRIREMAKENDIPEERTKKIIAAEVSNEDAAVDHGGLKEIYPPFEMPESDKGFVSPTAKFLERCEPTKER